MSDIADRFIEIVRVHYSDSPIRRQTMSDTLGVDLREVRRVRAIAEQWADFPIGCKRGYCRLETEAEIQEEIEWREAMGMGDLVIPDSFRRKMQRVAPWQSNLFAEAK